jgi:hypothetical protein
LDRLTQLGDGHLSAVAVIGGVFARAWINPRIRARFLN